jgi:hypothetical protein
MRRGMDEVVIEILTAYGLEVIVIALVINILTNLLKQPVKAYSKRSGHNLNKYISLIPVVLGLIGAALYYGFSKGWVSVRADEIASLAVSSASLSLAMFAIVEKFLPKKKDGETAELPEASADAALLTDAAEWIRKAAELLKVKSNTGTTAEAALDTAVESLEPSVSAGKKIILGHRREANDETETKEA